MANTAEELVLRISGDSAGGQAALDAIVKGLQALGPTTDDAKGHLDALITGMSAAGDAARPDKIIAGMSASGQAVQGFADTATSSFKDFGNSITEGLEHPLDAAKSALTEMLEGLGPVGVGIAAVGAAAVVAGGVLAEMGAAAAETGEGIRDFAVMTGESNQQVEQLSYVASVGGSSLDNMRGLAFLLERQMLATGASADKFSAGLSDLGINEDKFRDSALPDQIQMLSEGFNRGAESGNNMAAAVEVLGTRGRTYLPFLTKDLKDASDQASEFGLHLTDQDIKASEDFETSVRTLRTELGVLGTEIGAVIVPALNLVLHPLAAIVASINAIPDSPGMIALAKASVDAQAKQDGMTAGLRDFNFAALEVADHTVPTLADALKEQADATDDLNKKNKDLIASEQTHLDAVQAQIDILRQGVKPNQDLVEALEQVGNGLVQGTAESDRWVAAVKKMIDAGDDVPPLLRGMYDQLQPIAFTLPTMTGGIIDLGVATAGTIVPFGKLNSDLNMFGETIPKMTGGITDQTVAIAGTMKSFEELNGPVAKTTDTCGLFGLSSREAASDLKGLSQILGDIPGEFGKVASSIATVGASIEQGFESGGPIGAAISGVSSLISVLSGIGGPSKEELAARSSQADLITQLQGIATQGEITAGALASNYQTIAIVARDAYMQTGESADEAEVHVAALLDTHDPTAFAAALKDVNAVIQQNAANAQAAATATSNLAGDVNTFTKNGITDQGQMALAGRSVVDAFTAQVKATGDVGGALSALAPTLAALKAGETNLGLSGSAAVDQLLKMQDVTTANQGLMDSISGATSLIKDLGTSGALTHDDLTAFGQDAANQFAILTGKTGDANEALVMMQPELQALWEQQQKLGAITDASTQSLLDQATQQGLVGPQMQSVNDQMLTVLQQIRDVIAEATGNTQNFATALGNLPTQKTVTIDQNFTTDGTPVVPMAAGGSFTVTKPTMFLAGEAGTEQAMFSGANRTFGSQMSGGDMEALIRSVGGMRAAIENMPASIARSVRDAIQLAG